MSSSACVQTWDQLQSSGGLVNTDLAGRDERDENSVLRSVKAK